MANLNVYFLYESSYRRAAILISVHAAADRHSPWEICCLATQCGRPGNRGESRKANCADRKQQGERNKETGAAAPNSLCACQPGDNMSSAAEHARTLPPAQQVGQQGASEAGGQAGRQAAAYLNSE